MSFGAGGTGSTVMPNSDTSTASCWQRGLKFSVFLTSESAHLFMQNQILIFLLVAPARNIIYTCTCT